MKLFLFIILCFLYFDTFTCESYTVLRNTNVSVDNSYLLGKLKTRQSISCLVQCNLIEDCFSTVYNTDETADNVNCFLYSTYFDPSQLIASEKTNHYQKTCIPVETLSDLRCLNGGSTLFYIFDNYRQRVVIDSAQSGAFSAVLSTMEYRDVNGEASYYSFDRQMNRVIVFNDKFQLILNTTLNIPAFAVQVGYDLYISGNNNMYRVDKDVNITAIFNNTSASYRGILYDQTMDEIVAASVGKRRVDIFDRNLQLIGNISTSTYTPYSIAKYKDRFYVGTSDGNVLTIVNGTIIEISKMHFTNSTISCIHIDANGQMIPVGLLMSSIYLYHVNGTYLGKTMSLGNNAVSVNIDTKGRFIVSANTLIAIFY